MKAAAPSREAHLRALLEAAPDGVIIATTQGTIELVNAQTERLFGYSRDQLIGQPIEILVPERLRERHVGRRDAFIREPRIRPMGVGQELHGRRVDGSEFPVEISLSPVETEQGTLIIAAVRDDTERQQIRHKIEELNERLIRDNTELTAVNQELEAFSYSVSHDLRAPLRAIDGFSQALMEDCAGQLDDQGRDYLKRVRGAAQRMGRLIDDMIMLSRVTRSEMHFRAVDLSALAQAIAEDLKGRDRDRLVDVSIGSRLSAQGDARLLRIALENLLGNAWKFTAGRDPGRIEFGRCEEDGVAAFFVRDNGAGFDAAYADRLVQPFQRLHNDKSFPGTGIGLATVQRIVRRHGGTIWAEGEPNEGATFYFTLEQRKSDEG